MLGNALLILAVDESVFRFEEPAMSDVSLRLLTRSRPPTGRITVGSSLSWAFDTLISFQRADMTSERVPSWTPMRSFNGGKILNRST